MNREFWQGKRVFITGHTGFKGGWLTLYLNLLGAEIHGYALAPPTDPNLFTAAEVAPLLSSHTLADVRDAQNVQEALQDVRPDVLVHMAAQPLVQASYERPLDTFSTNVLGTANVLDAARRCPTIRAIVNVTSDKCYEPRDGKQSFREDARLGGDDPYSSSKACAELVTHAYRKSFLDSSGVAVATCRAGNVIGGGDWARDRLVPDFFRAVERGEPLKLRSPSAVRPWQHVLEPIRGYIMLAERLCTDGNQFAGPWNFGPSEENPHSVRDVVEQLAASNPEASWEEASEPRGVELEQLRVDSTKAYSQLNWRHTWSLECALDKTREWHAAWQRRENMKAFSTAQIRQYAGTA